ncbi:hypothetical protein ACFOEQ_10975 [Chryseobacterium arachidis]
MYPDCHAARATDDSVYVNVFDMDSKSPLDFETEIGIIEIYIYN